MTSRSATDERLDDADVAVTPDGEAEARAGMILPAPDAPLEQANDGAAIGMGTASGAIGDARTSGGTSSGARAVHDIRVGGRRVELIPHNCFACGQLNVHGLRIELHAADGRCWTELALADRFEGWEGIAHGGILCTLLDEVMAWALIDQDSWGVTARMSVTFKRPVPIGVPIRAEGWIVKARRRLLETEGQILDGHTGEVLATSTATYIAASEERKRQLKAKYRFRVGSAPGVGYDSIDDGGAAPHDGSSGSRP